MAVANDAARRSDGPPAPRSRQSGAGFEAGALAERLTDVASVLSTQWTTPRAVVGEAALFFAVLEDAVACATAGRLVETHGSDGAQLRRRRVQNALDWITSERRDYLFAFRNVCDVLTLDHVRVRAFVARGARYRSHRLRYRAHATTRWHRAPRIRRVRKA